MTDRVRAPHGAWPSPIAAARVASSNKRLGYPSVRGADVWWQEVRPAEGGRTTVMHRSGDGVLTELLAAPWDARTRVHEYGGRSYLPVSRGERHAIIFTDYADQRLYLLEPGAQTPTALTPQPQAPAALRYADFTLVPARNEVWCVREQHEDGEVRRSIVAVPLDGSAAGSPGAVRELVSGAHFYLSPGISPDGGQLAWLSWDHPRMPWDGTQLRTAPVQPDGSIGKSRVIKGGLNESVLAPWWLDDTRLSLISDWSGWWNLYETGIAGEPPLSLYPAEEEFAAAPWQTGQCPYVVLADGRAVVAHGVGDRRIGVLDPETAEISDLDVEYTHWYPELDTDGETVVGIAGGPFTPPSVVRIDMRTQKAEELRCEDDELPDAAYLPQPRTEEFEGPFGRPVHAFVYPPTNPEVEPPEGELPPYVVWVHGGPTGQVDSVLSMEKAYFTSRGIGIVDVNYGGSTGYGRHYRERLRRQWGVVDVDDAAAVAHAIAERKLADPGRIAIRGGSAGGWTTLAAITGNDAFAAGAAYFAVIDAAGFSEETHDFESRYLEGLIGPLPGFERTYVERSPLTRAGEARCPVLLLQGLDDPIVVPSQAERFVAALADKGIPHAYLAFEGESHGFRRADTKTACLEAELSFYGQVLGFEPTDVPQLRLTTGNDAGQAIAAPVATETAEQADGPAGQNT